MDDANAKPFPLLRLSKDTLFHCFRFLDVRFVIKDLSQVNKEVHKMCRDPRSVGKVSFLADELVADYKLTENGYLSMPIVIRKMFAPLISTVNLSDEYSPDFYEHWFEQMKDYVRPTELQIWEGLFDGDAQVWAQKMCDAWPSIKKLKATRDTFPVGNYPNIERVEVNLFERNHLIGLHTKLKSFPKLKRLDMADDFYDEEPLSETQYWDQLLSQTPNLRVFSPPSAKTESIFFMLQSCLRHCPKLIKFGQFQMSDVGWMTIVRYGKLFAILLSEYNCKMEANHLAFKNPDVKRIVELLKTKGKVLMNCKCFHKKHTSNISGQEAFCLYSHMRILRASQDLLCDYSRDVEVGMAYHNFMWESVWGSARKFWEEMQKVRKLIDQLDRENLEKAVAEEREIEYILRSLVVP